VFQLTPTRKFSSYRKLFQLKENIPAAVKCFSNRVVFQPQKSASAAGKCSTYKIMF
jgi:hypothetical protein